MKRFLNYLLFLTLFTTACSALNTQYIQSLLFEPSSEPTDTSEGQVYYDSGAQKLRVNTGSGFEDIGGGGAGTATLFFSDRQAEDTTLVTGYDDAAGTPVDLTGGTASNFTVSSETSNPLEGDTSYLFTKADATDAQGEGRTICTDITLDRRATAGRRPLVVQFDYETSADYETNDVTMWYVTDSDFTSAIALNGFSTIGGEAENGLYADQTGNGRFTASVTVGSNDTELCLGFHVATTETADYTIKVDDIKIGFNPTGVSPIIKSPTDISITTSWDSWATVTAKVTRFGNWGYFDVKWAITNAGSLSGTLAITDLGGLTIDTSVLQLNANDYAELDGSTLVRDVGTSEFMGGVQYLDSTAVIRPKFYEDNGTVTTAEFNDNITPTDPHSFANTDTVNAKFWAPIEEWDTSSNHVGSTEILFQGANVIYESTNNPAVGTSATKVTFNTIKRDEFALYSSGTFTAPVHGSYKVHGHILTDSESWTAGNRFAVIAYKNASQERVLADLRIQATHTGKLSVPYTGEIELEVGDTLEIYMLSSVATNVAPDADFSHLNISIDTNYSRLTDTGVSREALHATSSLKTPSATGHYHALTGNELDLTPGEWSCRCRCNFGPSGTPNYDYTVCKFGSADGTDAASYPADFDALSSVTGLWGDFSGTVEEDSSATYTRKSLEVEAGFRLTSDETLFCNTYATMGTAASARIQTFLSCTREQ